MEQLTINNCNVNKLTHDLPKENKNTRHKKEKQKKVSSISLPHIPLRCQQNNKDCYFTSHSASENMAHGGHRSCRRNETQHTPFLPLISTDNSPLISVFRSNNNNKERINSNNINKMTKRRSNKNQHEATESSSDMPTRTPEPEILKEFNVFVDGFAVVDEVHRKSSSYLPRYCWCTRCKMMYRMYKEGDKRLETWGNYPCFQF